MWAAEHIDALYPDISDNEYNDAYDFLLEHGWVRIGDSSVADYGVEALDPLNLPSYVIDWVNNHVHGKVDIEKYPARRGTRAVIELPVDDLQETINNEFKLQKLAPVAKQAAISGQTVNTILKLIEQNGGATYNLASNKNLVGTDAYAVAIYPERERIVDVMYFENLEGYLVENEDLLSNLNNSFGAWVSGGKTYLDVVATVADKNQAMELAFRNHQLAIFDLKNLVEIPVQKVAKLAGVYSDKDQQKIYDKIFSERWPTDSEKIDGGNEYYEWSELGSNDYPNPADEEKEHCLLDQLEKPINRNNPVGLGEYAITYYDAFSDQGDQAGM
jgi:hypothetical protein